MTAVCFRADLSKLYSNYAQFIILKQLIVFEINVKFKNHINIKNIKKYFQSNLIIFSEFILLNVVNSLMKLYLLLF